MCKKSRFGGIVDHTLTDNNLNQHVNNTNPSTNDILSNVTHNVTLPQLSHASALAAKPNLPTFIWIILLLSTCPVALYLPKRYLSFHVGSHSALLHDIINWPQVLADNYYFSRRMRLAEYFFHENSNTSTAKEHDTPLDR